jgi:hypothetical protein
LIKKEILTAWPEFKVINHARDEKSSHVWNRQYLKGTSNYLFSISACAKAAAGEATESFARRLCCKNSKDLPSIPAFLRFGVLTKSFALVTKSNF